MLAIPRVLFGSSVFAVGSLAFGAGLVLSPLTFSVHLAKKLFIDKNSLPDSLKTAFIKTLAPLARIAILMIIGGAAIITAGVAFPIANKILNINKKIFRNLDNMINSTQKKFSPKPHESKRKMAEEKVENLFLKKNNNMAHGTSTQE